MEGPRVRHAAQGGRVRQAQPTDPNRNARQLLRRLHIDEATIERFEAAARAQRTTLAAVARAAMERET